MRRGLSNRPTRRVVRHGLNTEHLVGKAITYVDL